MVMAMTCHQRNLVAGLRVSLDLTKNANDQVEFNMKTKRWTEQVMWDFVTRLFVWLPATIIPTRLLELDAANTPKLNLAAITKLHKLVLANTQLQAGGQVVAPNINEFYIKSRSHAGTNAYGQRAHHNYLLKVSQSWTAELDLEPMAPVGTPKVKEGNFDQSMHMSDKLV